MASPNTVFRRNVSIVIVLPLFSDIAHAFIMNKVTLRSLLKDLVWFFQKVSIKRPEPSCFDVVSQKNVLSLLKDLVYFFFWKVSVKRPGLFCCCWKVSIKRPGLLIFFQKVSIKRPGLLIFSKKSLLNDLVYWFFPKSLY